jgi:RNA polymerase sigma factor (sigma-70 family)
VTPADLDAVCREMRPALVRWASSLVPHRVAEDVAQEALMALTRHRDRVSRQEAAAWLREAVRRQALAAWRGLREMPEEAPEVAASETPEDTLVSAQLTAAVRRAMDDVAESRRRILQAVTIDERQVVDVAREVGIPESTAHGRLEAATTEVRDALHRQRVAERRRTGGSSSWMLMPFMDVRAWWRRALALLGTTAAVAAGGASLHISPTLGPTPEEPLARAAEVEPLRLPTPLPAAEHGVERVSNPYEFVPRARHDVAARMLAERMRRPE